MDWREYIEEDAHLVMPWLGGRRIHREGRSWRVVEEPPEYGWYSWVVRGREARFDSPCDQDPEYRYDAWARKMVHGYLIGNRLVPDNTEWTASEEELPEHTIPVFLVEPGLDRFTRASVELVDCHFVFREVIFPLGPEDDARKAFVDRRYTVGHIADVTPALDLAFRFACLQRRRLEERRAHLEHVRREERRREELSRNISTSLGRRTIAAYNFEEAAKSALALSGAELLDVRPGAAAREMVVQYRFSNRRFECVVERDTMRIVDSGVCLTDERTGDSGDSFFTLESLPGVINEALLGNKLVVYRHVE